MCSLLSNWRRNFAPASASRTPVPLILKHPEDVQVQGPGHIAYFTVIPNRRPGQSHTIHCQWFRNDVELEGATDFVLSFPVLTEDDVACVIRAEVTLRDMDSGNFIISERSRDARNTAFSADSVVNGARDPRHKIGHGVVHCPPESFPVTLNSNVPSNLAANCVWIHPTKGLLEETRGETTLKIDCVQASDEGDYKCQIMLWGESTEINAGSIVITRDEMAICSAFAAEYGRSGATAPHADRGGRAAAAFRPLDVLNAFAAADTHCHAFDYSSDVRVTLGPEPPAAALSSAPPDPPPGAPSGPAPPPDSGAADEGLGAEPAPASLLGTTTAACCSTVEGPGAAQLAATAPQAPPQVHGGGGCLTLHVEVTGHVSQFEWWRRTGAGAGERVVADGGHLLSARQDPSHARTSATLAIPHPSADDQGVYQCICTREASPLGPSTVVATAPVEVLLGARERPVITVQPPRFVQYTSWGRDPRPRLAVQVAAPAAAGQPAHCNHQWAMRCWNGHWPRKTLHHCPTGYMYKEVPGSPAGGPAGSPSEGPAAAEGGLVLGPHMLPAPVGLFEVRCLVYNGNACAVSEPVLVSASVRCVVCLEASHPTAAAAAAAAALPDQCGVCGPLQPAASGERARATGQCGVDPALLPDGVFRSCCHQYVCRECWTRYVDHQCAQREPPVPVIRCPGEGCGRALKPDEVRGAASSAAVVEAWTALKAQNHALRLLHIVAEIVRAQDPDASDEATELESEQAITVAPPASHVAADGGGAGEHWALNTVAVCPSCKVIVNRFTGCDHMSCTCGTHFNYSECLLTKEKALQLYNELIISDPIS